MPGRFTYVLRMWLYSPALLTGLARLDVGLTGFFRDSRRGSGLGLGVWNV
jgi:hypothetical protein